MTGHIHSLPVGSWHLFSPRQERWHTCALAVGNDSMGVIRIGRRVCIGHMCLSCFTQLYCNSMNLVKV